MATLIGTVKLLTLFPVLIGAGVVAFVIQGVSYLTLRQISETTHRKLVTRVSYCFLLVGTFLLQHWSKIRLITYGDSIPDSASVLCIVNHYSNIDFLIGLAWLSRLGYPSPGNVKAVVKKSLGSVPIFGWILKFSEFVFLTRSWERDQSNFVTKLRKLSTFPSTGLPYWLVLFPEGSRLQPDKLANSQKFAQANNYPTFNNVLLPRFKGFQALVPEIRSSINYVVDVTLMFEGKKPSMSSVLKGTADNVIHVHIRTHPISTIPRNEEGIKDWLLQRWIEKETRIQEFSDGKNTLGPRIASEDDEHPPSVTGLYLLFAIFVVFAAPILYAVSRFDNGIRYLLLANSLACAAVALFVGLVLRPSAKGKTKRNKKAL